MTSIQAVLGLQQLDRLAVSHDLRAGNAAILADTANDLLALRTPAPGPGVGHAHYRFYTFVRPDRLRSGWSRDRVIADITAAGVPCFSGSCSEIYLEKAFTANGMAPLNPLPVAHELGETSLAFLVDPAQDIATIQNTAAVLREVVMSATLDSEHEMTS
jgi:dTDP-4-amino-4,6-dideoxygalactose transaminase